MSIKIEGGDGTAENVIKAGTSNELLYNDKEVLLKENFGLDLGLLPPDLKKAEEWRVVIDYGNGSVEYNGFAVPEDGWIVKVDLFYNNGSTEVTDRYFIAINRFGALGMTPGYDYIDGLTDYLNNEPKIAAIHNLNCPYPVKKGQVISNGKQFDFNNKYNVTVTFAPCMRV